MVLDTKDPTMRITGFSPLLLCAFAPLRELILAFRWAGVHIFVHAAL
jgi:hypothetical protein